MQTLQFIQQLFLYLGFTAFIFLFLGLIKPWIMLWWEHVQNRRKVIRLYGGIGLFSFAVYAILNYLQ